MGLQATLGVVEDAIFQGRCRIALLETAIKVLANEAGYPSAGQASVNPADDTAYAQKVLTKTLRVDPEVLANFVLRNATVAAAPTTDTTPIDDAMRWEINNAAWAGLREIG